MFQALVRLGVRRWPFVLLGAALFSIIGYNAFRSLPIEAFPDVTDPQVEIVGLYPGQSAEEVEKRVTLELERVLSGTPRLLDLRSVSVFGLTLVTLTFAEGTSDFQLRTLVAERLRDAELPDTASTVMGPQATPVGQIYRYTLRGNRSLKDLRSLNDFVVERRLRAVQGVADVWTFGGFQRQYQARIDPARLAAAGLSLKDVHDALARTNANAGGGYVGLGSQEFVVRGLGAVVTPADIGLAVVREVNGVPVRVRDVADIVEGSTPRRGSVGRGHEDEVVEGIVMLRRGENPSTVLDALRTRIQQLNDDVLPRDVRIDTFYDRTALVDATLATVSRNMVEGALLVIAVVYLFLRTLRGAIIIALVIPMSLLAAFVGLRLTGLPANLISLGAIDFGIIVDAAVIVLEVSLHALHKGGSDKSGTIEAAAGSVARPVGFAMLIIIIALAPIFSLERTEGRIFAPMAFTYAFALLGALVCGTLVVPALEVAILPAHVSGSESAWLVRARAVVTGTLERLSARRAIVLSLTAAALVVLAAYAKGIGNEFLPELNEGGFYITTTFPSTISLDETKIHTREIRERILRLPEALDVLSHIGRPEAATRAEGSFNAEFFVPLASESKWRPAMTRQKLEAELRSSLREIPGARHNFSQPITDRVFETISGIIGQVVIKVRGEDLEGMTRVADDLVAVLTKVRGVADLAPYQAGDIPQLRIELDRDAIGRRGLSVADVQETIEIALGGSVATEIWQGERRYDVALRLPDTVRGSTEALGRLVVDSDHRTTLAEVAKVEYGRGRTSIWREDFSRFVAVKFNVRGRDLGSTVADAKAAAANLEVPEGVWLTWGGEFQNQARAMGRLSVALPLSLAAIVAALYANFRRLRPALTIVGALPFAVVGAVAGLRAMGENFSVSSAVGCIALLGQIVLAGVLICTRIDEAAQSGSSKPMSEGVAAAFRPVLLTTSLALLGLMPAALSHAMGSETQRPFAIAIIAGLVAGIPVVLFLVPLAYGGRAPPGGGTTPPSAAVAATLLAAISLAMPRAAYAAPDGTLGARADSAGGFTLATALSAMRQGQQLLAVARANVRAAAADARGAGLWTNPIVDGTYANSLGQSGYDPAGAWTAGVTQFLEVSGAPAARSKAARAEARAAEQDAATLERTLSLDVEAAFVNLAASVRRREILAESLLDLERADRIVHARVSSGVSPEYDGSRVAIALAAAKAALGVAAAEVDRTRGDLVVAVGIGGRSLHGVPVMDFDRLPSLPPLDDLLTRADRSHPALLAARLRAESSDRAVAVAERSTFPGVGVRVGAGFGQSPGQKDLMLGLVVPVPLIDSGQARIPAARSRAEAAHAYARALSTVAAYRIAAAHAELRHMLEAVASYRAEAKRIGDAMRVEAEAGYREARLSVFELVDAYESLRDSRLRLIELQRGTFIVDVELRRASAVTPEQ